MKRAILLICAVIIASALIAGCSSPTQAEIKPVETTATMMTTSAPTAMIAQTATLDLVVTLPPEQYVDLQLTKDRPTAEIHLLYNGGKGEVFVQKVRMRVTRSDGTVVDQFMDDGKKPMRGDELIIQGTRGSDRCEVWVTTAGKEYKIIDQPLISMQ